MTARSATAWLRAGDRTLDLAHRVAVMGIVNRTPDSFYDRGATFALDTAVEAGRRAVEDGAEIVDVGGVKFAPGPPVPVEEEIARVVPVVRELAGVVAVSVDTFQPEVARAAIAAGAAIINDTTGLADPAMAQVVADSDAAVVVAHSLAAPRTQLPMPRYDDVVAEVVTWLEDRRARALAAGIPPDRIILDPGHDLNKNTLHSLELTRRLGEVAALGSPLLVALSNKDFIGETLGRDRAARLAGSLAAAVYCVQQGARIVRVHNVAETVDAVRMLEAILGWRVPPADALVHNMRPEGNE
ncbi:dihydropteroate synthase [Microbacterium thalassium]|uniref:Dihydropteroate synthase n=1 Tax=Microbacterium thalassium TaxID=362649 RepID=A0A7X0KVS7_9MICO|nr:dihydropteroate synthase [Microbacterium thalassium]MBB6392552.1 dihydropteroate synthase [Microbacterium thalassium]GLK23217.1 dihydropteroate synthase [Microbacterium thalassium]